VYVGEGKLFPAQVKVTFPNSFTVMLRGGRVTTGGTVGNTKPSVSLSYPHLNEPHSSPSDINYEH
jgi:hypothetical protein